MSEKLQQDHYKITPKKIENNIPPNNEEQENQVPQYLQGRGAQFNTKNRFIKNEKTREHIEAVDDWSEDDSPTQYLE